MRVLFAVLVTNWILLVEPRAAHAAAEIVARVGTETVEAEDVIERVRITRAAGGSASVAPLVDDLVNEILLANEARRAGLARDPAVKAAAEAARRRRAAERLVEEEIASIVTVDDAGLLAMYHSTADSVKLAKFVYASRVDAQAGLDRLRGGAKPAEEIRRTLDPSAVATGGAATLMSRGQLDEGLAKVAFATPLRTFTGPIELKLGWAVIRVENRQVGDAAGFAAKRKALRKFAVSETRAQYRTHYVHQLRQKAGIALDTKFIESTGVGLGPTPAEADHVVATVGDRELKYGAVVSKVRRLFGGREGGHASGPSVKSEYAWQMVDEMLLEDAAVERGFGRDPAARKAARDAEKRALVLAYTSKIRKAAGMPSAAEVATYHREHASEFRRPPRRRCWHLAAGSRDEAERLRRRVEHGEAFEAVARKSSRDPSTAAQGGLLGELTDARIAALSRPDGEPAFANAIRKTPAGALSGPISTRAGWHIVRCEAPQAAGVAPINEVRTALAARLEAKRGNDAVRKRIAGLRARARIQVDTAAVGRIGARSK